MPDVQHRRRFIAGAVCPHCALIDKMVVDLETDQRICVSCGFREDRPGIPAANTELPTRVSRAAARRVQTPAEAITLIDVGESPAKPKA